MDPMSALTIATSALQIVDFSVKTFAKIREFYDSSSSQITEYEQLGKEVENLQRVNSHLTEILAPRNLKRQRTSLEEEVVGVCQECAAAALKLAQVLKSVSIDSKDGKWTIVRRAVKAIWLQEDIGRLNHQMKSSRERLTATMLGSIK
jgi:hypothetical protein